jgi:hypothetical protein
MKELSLNNQRLQKILSGLIDDIFDDSEVLETLTSQSILTNIDKDITHDAYGEDYLREALKRDYRKWGYPRASWGMNTERFESKQSRYYNDLINTKISRLGTYVGSPVNALCMFYPANGYIGWHHNGNAGGYNVLLTYNPTGNGYFQYYDRETDSIQKQPDRPGWTVRVGYYPHEKQEPENVFWHSAYTEDPRVTIAFVFNERDFWVNFIDDVTCGEYDHEDILAQGPKSINV